MHKCINNSENDTSHLEQVTNEFFPYSQKQLGFDRPVTIIFQSDAENSSKMLGKTAFYNPETFEVVLYTDSRHPKDVLRSLSHELVHHAQNCRGDFSGQNNTGAGYAQEDPHLRKMEREAYTKGNLIFRDFEDLIKTGKINIEIDFSDSGEPKMSLKEWKNNEINTKLMKKWGFLTESTYRHEDEKKMGEDHPEGEDHVHGPECGCPDMEEGMQYRDDELDTRTRHLKRGKDGKLEPMERDPDYKGIGSKEHDDEEGDRPSMALESALTMENTSGKISVREAKQITRRIIERIKKESK
tara:strand:+ start:187 stop:1080 length:894 start_codon:yes stop_codon:yes gene_type:complete